MTLISLRTASVVGVTAALVALGCAPAGAVGAGHAGRGSDAHAAKSGLPKHFPLPSGAKVLRHVKDGKETDVTVKVHGEHKAYTFWRKALPKAGYRTHGAEYEDGYGQIYFKGHHYAGDTQITFTGSSHVTVQLDHT